MSENIFDEKDSFFGNLDISNTTKLGVMAILLGGTYEIYTNPNGRKTFVSTINLKDIDENGGNGNSKNVKKITVMYDLGNPDSLAENAQQAIANSMGIDNFKDICSGKYSESEVIKKLRDTYKNSYGLSDQGVKANSEIMISKIEDLLKRQMSSVGPEVVNNLTSSVAAVYGGLQNQNIDDKKKQMTEAVEG